MHRSTAAVLVVMALSLLLPIRMAHACSCVPPPGDREAMLSTDVVFSGTVTEVADPEGDKKIVSSGRPVTYSFHVDAVAKGEVAADESVTSAADGSSCGAEFRDGGRYIVFADENKNGELTTSLCSNTRPLAENEEIDFVSTREPAGGGSTADGPRTGEGVPAIAWLGIAAILGIGAVTFFATRRRTA